LSERGVPEGAAQNSCDTIVVRFEKGDPESIVWIGGVLGQVHPEHEVYGKERTYDLPGRPEDRKKPQKRKRQFTYMMIIQANGCPMKYPKPALNE